jgi:hypothetical protein
MSRTQLPRAKGHSDLWVAVVCLSLIGVTFFSIFSLRGAKLLFAGILAASLLVVLLLRASHRPGEP